MLTALMGLFIYSRPHQPSPHALQFLPNSQNTARYYSQKANEKRPTHEAWFGGHACQTVPPGMSLCRDFLKRGRSGRNRNYSEGGQNGSGNWVLFVDDDDYPQRGASNAKWTSVK